MKDLIATLRASGIVRTFEPATQREIDAASKRLGVAFPAVYRDFLLACGVMLISTFQQPRPIRVPMYAIPGFRRLDRAGLGWPETPIHDRFVFGLGPSTAPRAHITESVVFQTEVARGAARLLLPRHLIAIWDDHHYYYHCLDIRRLKHGDCPIVRFDWSTGQKNPQTPKDAEPGFCQWLAKRVAAQLRMKKRVEAALEVPRRAGKKRRE